MMKPTCFMACLLACLLFTLPATRAFAQDENWKEEVKKKRDSEKITYLISYAQKRNHDEASLDPLRQAMQLAEASHIDTLQAKASVAMARYYQENNNVHKAWGLLQQAKLLYIRQHQFNHVNSVLYQQSTILTRTADADSLIRFLDKNQALIALASKPTFKNYLKQMYGYAYMMLNKNKEAQQVFTSLIPDAKAARDTDLVIALYMNMGQLQPSFDSSMAWYRQVLDITKKFDKSRYVALLRDIGAQYSLRDDAKKDSALYYFLEAEKNVAYMNEPVSRVVLYNWMGEFMYRKNEFPMALSYFRKAYETSRLMEKPEAIPLNNLAMTFLALKQHDSAGFYRKLYEQAVSRTGSDYELLLMYQLNAMYAKATGDSCSLKLVQNYEKAIGITAKLGNTKSATETLTSGLMDCLTANPSDKAISQLAKSILKHCHVLYPLLKQEGKLLVFAGFLERYAALEELYGERAHAFILYKELAQVQKQIHDKKYTDGINEAVVKYKSELKDAEIRLLNEKDKASASRTRFILAGMIALACILVLIFILYRRENKNKRELDTRNKKVEELLREIHHRVKNNLQIVSSFINIQIDRVKDHESVESLLDTSRRIMALANLHHSLYRQDDFAHVEMAEYIKELSDTIKSSMPLVDVEMQYDLARLELEMDQAIPLGLSLNELLTNALKYAFTGSTQKNRIRISLLQKEGEWELTVRDNGKGLPAETETNAARKSIGLRLVQNLVQRQVKGTFKHYNDNGAVFVVGFRVDS